VSKIKQIQKLVEEVAVLTKEVKKLATTLKTVRGEYAEMKLWMVKTKPYGVFQTTIYDLFKECRK